MIDFEKVADGSRASIEKADLKVLLPIIADIRPRVILEVGMHQGYSMEVWRKAFHPACLIGLECDPVQGHYYDEMGSMWQTNSQSADTLYKVKFQLDDKVDFLFIDGDHSYEGVKKDFEMYSPLVRKGGIIVFHDVVYTSDDPYAPVQVKRLWDELKTQYKSLEIKESGNSTGIGVIWV